MQDTQASTFWTWFTENQHKYLFVNDIDETERARLFEELKLALHAYNDRLFFEIGGHKQSYKLDLIISAEGIKELFAAVETLVAAAPELPNWNIIALKPPMGPGYKVKYGGLTFDPEQTIFIPLDNPDNPTGVGLWICYPDFDESSRATYIGGTFLMLDSILGERSTAMHIDHLEVVRTPDNISDYPFLHLSSIKEYILAKKFVQ